MTFINNNYFLYKMKNKNSKKIVNNNCRKDSRRNKYISQKKFIIEENNHNFNRYNNLSDINNFHNEKNINQNQNNKNRIFESRINKKPSLVNKKNKKQINFNNFIKLNNYHSNLMPGIKNKLTNYKEQYIKKCTNNINIINRDENLVKKFRDKSYNKRNYRHRLKKMCNFGENNIKNANDYPRKKAKIPTLINIDLTKKDKIELKESIKTISSNPNPIKKEIIKIKKYHSQKGKEIPSIKIDLDDIIEDDSKKLEIKNNYYKFESLNEYKNKIYKSYFFEESQNKECRDSMEDFHDFQNLSFNNFICHYFAIFDGHNGKEVSLYLKENFQKILLNGLNSISFTKDYKLNNEKIKASINSSFEKMDKKIINNKSIKDDIGSTGTIILLYRDPYNLSQKVLISANVGDSKGFLLTKENITQITKDHLCNDINEVERIKKRGGVVFQGRVFGSLMLTRSFGDKEMKQYGILGEPYIYSCFLGEKDLYVIVASDGVWDVISSEDLFNMSNKEKISSEELAKNIVKTAIDKGTNDNVTCLIVKLG